MGHKLRRRSNIHGQKRRDLMPRRAEPLLPLQRRDKGTKPVLARRSPAARRSPGARPESAGWQDRFQEATRTGH